MKYIQLSQGKRAKVDDEDYDGLSKFSWWYSSTKYAYRSQWLYRSDRKQKNIPMHREIMGVSDSKILVDHINGDKLDNRRSNLRLSTKSTNGCNRGMTLKNTSGFKGVTKHNQCQNRWISQIRVNNKNIYLGLYASPQEAAAAYDKAALLHFGEYAKVNGL